MIGYEEVFEFTNDVGSFVINAHTEEHPSGYGNGTLLVFDIDSDFPCERRMSFDVRYEQEDMPTLASELNHVEKAIQTDIGVIVTATEEMRVAGGFDPACGTFEKYVDFLRPMGMVLTAPLVIVGLEPPRTFHVEHEQDGRRKLGRIVSHL